MQPPESAPIRPCGAADRRDMLQVINEAATAYRNVIPADRYHEPYMSDAQLESEIADGVVFSAYDMGGLAGVMGVQAKSNVDLIRHAYVRSIDQGKGIGAALLAHLLARGERPVLVGTWRAADWAIRFYQRHGFACVRDADIAPLLRAYWAVPARQIETSVVLARPALDPGEPQRLIAASGL